MGCHPPLILNKEARVAKYHFSGFCSWCDEPICEGDHQFCRKNIDTSDKIISEIFGECPDSGQKTADGL